MKSIIEPELHALIHTVMHFELGELKYAYFIRMMYKYLQYQISLNGYLHLFSTELFQKHMPN